MFLKKRTGNRLCKEPEIAVADHPRVPEGRPRPDPHFQQPAEKPLSGISQGS